MAKIILILAGHIFLALGIIGIAVPGLPSTPFFLISAACFIRSSTALYTWLINHRIFGRHIKTYREHKAMPLKSKIISLCVMWLMIICTIYFSIENKIIKAIIVLAGIIGTITILRIKTLKYNENRKTK